MLSGWKELLSGLKEVLFFIINLIKTPVERIIGYIGLKYIILIFATLFCVIIWIIVYKECKKRK